MERSPQETNFCVVVGKFEALHRGHRHLIETARTQARAQGLTPAVLRFDPHPQQVLLNPGYAPLYTPDEYALLQQTLPADVAWRVQPFDRAFAQSPPQDFLRRLYEDERCRALVVGEGFRFGHERAGDPQLATRLGAALGMTVTAVPPLTAPFCIQNGVTAGETICTSRIRRLLAEGRTEAAAILLGQPFFVAGTVQRGRQLGRGMGFPTANLHPPQAKFLPPDGVYAAWVFYGGQRFGGVTHIGTNPTIPGNTARKVETHLFDFDGDLYGQALHVELLHHLRPEQTFAGPDALKAQMQTDAARVREWLVGDGGPYTNNGKGDNV